MKVRHKKLGIEFEVRKENVTLLHVGGNFYETVGGSFIAYHDPDWEKVEEWEDVTSEFHGTQSWPSTKSSKSNGVAHTETNCMFWIPCEIHHRGDLRLRKIDGLHNGPAFVVERRKS